MSRMLPFVGGCAVVVTFAFTPGAGAQFVIAPDVYQDSFGLNVGPSYSGPVLPGSVLDPYATSDYRGASSDGNFDAYDGAGILLFAPSSRGFSPITVNRRADALTTLNVYRWIDTYTNQSEEPIAITAYFWTNLGSDGNEVVAAQDPFRFVSFENDGDGETPSDPVVAMMHGNNQWTADNIALERFGVGRRGEGSDFYSDDLLRTFRLTLAPGESQSIMFADFLAYTPTDLGDDFYGDPGSPEDVALGLDRSAALLADPSDLFADLGRGEIAQIANWTIPTPSPTLLLTTGFLAIGRRRR